jgi:hypothetical protein
MNYADQIEEILDWFDFEKVHKVMESLDWKWFSIASVPQIPHLRQKARSLLQHVANEEPDCTTATGGFVARHDKYGRLSLSFVVAEFRSEPQED